MVKGVHETQSGAQSEAAAQVPPHATGAATVTSPVTGPSASLCDMSPRLWKSVVS
jgi:hypothetical protein